MITTRHGRGPGLRARSDKLIRLINVAVTASIVTTLGVTLTACSAEHTEDGHANVSASGPASAPVVASGTSSETSSAKQVASNVATPIRVFKDPSCGCCNAWVKHMRDSGFNVTTVDEPSQTVMDSIKQAHGVTQNTASCHTAEVGRYVIEGHVPAELVQKLLRENPADVVGLSVPGMVTGSPGMEGPDPEHYTVLAIMRDGSTHPYAQR